MEVAEVKQNQGVLKSTVMNTHDKVSKLKCVPTFKDRICGKWKNMNSSGQIMSIEINGDRFIVEYSRYERTAYTFVIEGSNGYSVHLEGEKIVLPTATYRREFYLENEMLVILDKVPGKENAKHSYTRIKDYYPK